MSKSEMQPTISPKGFVTFRIVLESGEETTHKVLFSALMREMAKETNIEVIDFSIEIVYFKIKSIIEFGFNRVNDLPNRTFAGNFLCDADKFLRCFFPKYIEEKICSDLEAEFINDLENERIAADRAKYETDRAENIAEDMDGRNM